MWFAERSYLRRLEALPGASYSELAGRVGEAWRGIQEREPDPANPSFSALVYVNLTGLGLPFLDALLEAGGVELLALPVYTTHGDRREVADLEGKGPLVTLGKGYLVSRLQLLLQDVRLHLPKGAESVGRELLEVVAVMPEDASDRYGAWSTGPNDHLVTALGLATQLRLGGLEWKEEMSDKFGIRDFMIYGDDFHVQNAEQWRLFNNVIVSVDRLKRDEHRALVQRTEPWDLIVFDEAHGLTRVEYGFKYETSQRYQLAQQLRGQTENVLLLTGTPHQGRDDKFRGLLELLRPGRAWRDKFLKLRTNPTMLRDLIIRNRKADVTDSEGEFIFKGKTTHTVQVNLCGSERDFDHNLRTYLQQGYAAGVQAGRQQGKAIGFVMTTYRKLAASSLAAIATALRKRQVRLLGEEETDSPLDEEADARFVERDEQVAGDRREFFGGELKLLETLAQQAERLQAADSKVRYFLNHVVRGVLERKSDERLLVFTEYRTTQDHLVRSLRERYGQNAVSLICGGQTLAERQAAIRAFEEQGQFLVSTEAGGEGLNLQRNCHLMVNFDLPWNPMRLVQRVGRLYRYGQAEKVAVFNMHVPDTLDSDILQVMYTRLETVAEQMAEVSGEYAHQSDLKEDILGQLVSNLDIQEVLEQAASDGLDRSRERIEAALTRAREAAEHQEAILRYASGYDPDALKAELKLGGEHLKAFAQGMCQQWRIEIVQRLYNDGVWDLRLPKEVQRELGTRQNIRLAFERTLATRAAGAELFSPEHDLFRFFARKAKDVQAGGLTADITGMNGQAVFNAMLRWMNDRGQPVYQEYVNFLLERDGDMTVNGEAWANWLLEHASDTMLEPPSSYSLWEMFQRQLGTELKRRMRQGVHPDTLYPLGAAWCDNPEL